LKKYLRSKSLLVAKATNRFPEGSDPGVDAYDGVVADPVFEKIHDSVIVILQGFGRSLDWLQSAVGGPEVPFLPEFIGPGLTLVTPQMTDVFLDRPSPGSLQVSGPQLPKFWPVLGGQVLVGVEPDILGASQNRTLPQRFMFLLPDCIHRLVDMLHRVIAVTTEKSEKVAALRDFRGLSAPQPDFIKMAA